MIGETVVRVRPGQPTGEKDRYGHDVLGPATETSIVRCAFAPAGSTEPVEAGRTAVITNDTVYAPAGTDVTPADQLRVRGLVRDVEGRPAVWLNPHNGREVGVVIRLKIVEG